MRCNSLRFRIFSRWVCLPVAQRSFVSTSIPVSASRPCAVSCDGPYYPHACARPCFHPRIPSALLRGRRYADGVLHILDRGLCLEMVEHEVDIHSVGPAADQNLKRLDTWWHAFVLEPKDRQTFIRTRPLPVLSSTNTFGITGIHLESLPAPGGLETRMSWGLARLARRWNAANALSSLLRVASCMRLWSDPSMSGKSLRIAVSDRLCSANEMRSRWRFQAVVRSSRAAL